MKKNLLAISGFIMCAFFASRAHAQFNQVSPYAIPGTGHVEIAAVDIIAADGGTTVTMGTGYTGVGYLTIKKLTPFGTPIFNRVFSPNDPTAGIAPSKIIQTNDLGFLVVGSYTSSTQPTTPFVAKFDAAGNFSWLNYYPNTPAYNGSKNFVRTDIVRAADDVTEDYVVETFAGPDDTSAYWQDVYTDVFKIDSAGTLLWHNKYVPSFARSGYAAIWDNSSTISFIEHGGDHKPFQSSYLIAGSTQWWSASDQQYLFYIGIDDNGNIAHSYTTYYVPSYPFLVSSIFDNNTTHPAVCLGYTFGNTGSISPYTASAIALTKIDPYYNLFSTQCYYIPQTYATENYGCSIAKTNDPDSGYILGSISYFNAPIPPGYSGKEAGLLKVSQAGVPDFYDQYNVPEYWTNTTQVADVQAPGFEYYAFAGTITNSALSDYNIQIVATDVNGYTCDTTQPGVADTTYSAPTTPYDYTPVAETGTVSALLVDVNGGSDDVTCIPPPLRKAAPAGVTTLPSVAAFRLYPTLLSDNNDQVTIDYNAVAGTQLEVKAYTVDGKLVTGKLFDVVAGDNTLLWNMPLTVSGNYIIKIVSADGSFSKTVRVSKL